MLHECTPDIDYLQLTFFAEMLYWNDRRVILLKKVVGETPLCPFDLELHISCVKKKTSGL